MEDGDEIIPNDGHGIEKIAVKWSEINAGTSPSAITQAVELGYPTFSSDHTTFELPFEMYGISDQDHMLYSHTEGAEWEISLKLGTTKIPNYDYDYGFYEWRGASLTNQGNVFYRTETGDIELRLANGVVETVADGAEPPTKIHHATRVTHTPEAMDMIALSPSLWIRDSSSWKKIKKHPQAKEFITGIGVSEDGVILENETTILRNEKKMSIQNLVNSTEWSGFKMAKMNDNGMMAGVATKEGDEKVVLLLPVDIAVDANRDGEIKFDGSDKTTAEKTYQFWVNDDRDIGHSVDVNVFTGASDWEEDDVEDGNDALEHGVKYRRDLEDFTRIRLDLRSLQELLKVEYPMFEGFQLTVTLEAISGQPEINLFKAVEIDGGREYLKDSDTGWNQLQDEYGSSIASVKGGNVWNIIDEVLNDSKEGDGYAHLLFEGVKKGKGKLRFKLTKAGQLVGELPPVYLELKDVTDMYETYTVGDESESGIGSAWPASSATPTSGQNLPEPQTDEEKDYVLFVHGWNMPGWEKEAFAATMFKRMWHQGYKGRFGAYRWPTFWGFSGYWDAASKEKHFDYSEHRAWNSAAPLKELLDTLSSTYTVRVYAHSMGNVVAAEALRLGAPAHTYISAMAALSADVWDNSVGPMGFHYLGIDHGPTTANVYGYYWQQGATFSDDIGKWKNENRPSYMDSQYMPSTTRYINHYNPDDWALALDNWQLNQMLKPDLDYQYERWYLTSWYGFTHNTSLVTEEKLEFPDDRYKIFSFAAESRSFATGAEGGTRGVFGNSINVNLKTEFGFEEEHKGHSGQFRSFIQKRWTYWERVLEDMKIATPQF